MGSVMVTAMTREKSLLPGWDPYVLRYWRDVHQSLVVYTRDDLRAQLPSELRARVEERVVLEAEDWGMEKQSYVPDVAITEWPRSGGGGGTALALREVAEPYRIIIPAEPITEGYIEIRDLSSGGRLVTTIEFASPTNKTPGKGADGFRKKQKDCLRAKVSLVEIDLIRGGEHILSIPFDEIEEGQQQTPCACVTEAWKPNEFLFYPIRIEGRLPVIRIPLRESDTQARLDIQAVFDHAYLNGEYGADIDYSKAPKAELTIEETAWLEAHLGAKLRA